MRGIRYMKAYEIRDYESEENVGVLLYYEQGKILS